MYIYYILLWTTKDAPNFQVRRSFHVIEVERCPKNNKIISYVLKAGTPQEPQESD